VSEDSGPFVSTSSTTRRAVLGTTVATLLGGCQSILGSSQKAGSRLGRVGLVNLTTEPQSVDFRVVWKSETVVDTTYDLPANNPAEDAVPSVVPERVWPTTEGKFSVSAREVGSEWRTVDPAQQEYPDCLSVQVLIDDPDGLSILTSQDKTECQLGGEAGEN